MPRQLNVWLFGHPIGTLAQRLPALAQTQWASWQARGDDHPILAQIVALVDDTSSQVQGIATAAEEQSATSEEINRAEEQVSRLSSEIAQGMRESAGVVESVARQVDALEDLVATFRDRGDGKNR